MKATFLLQDIFHIIGVGVIFAGEVKSGVIDLNSRVFLGDKNYSVSGIEAKNQKVHQAQTGQNVGIALAGANDKKIFNHFKGQIITFINN